MRVPVYHNLEFFMRKRIQLLNADNRHILEFMLPAVRQQVVIYLPAARDEAAHIFWIEFFSFWNDILETALREVFEARYRFLVTQETFGAHDDKRLAKRADHLAPKHVKHLCGGGRNAYLDIVFRA